MLKNYFKVAWRNIVRNKVYSTLNILGLAVGMAVALTIGLWVRYQYAYDNSLPGFEQSYQVKRNFNSNGDTLTFNTTSLKLADALRNNIPGIEYVAETDWMGSHGLKVGNEKFYLPGAMVGSDFLKIFPYPFVAGNAASVLKDPYSIVLTESTAKALFGNKDAMNQLVKIDNQHDLKVTGILKDLAPNNTFQFKYVVPFSYAEQTRSYIKEARTGNFSDNSFQVFVKLKSGASLNQVAAQIRDIEKSETGSVNAQNSKVILQVMKDWHLHSNYKNGVPSGGFIDYVRIFSIIGLLVLVIACINFINLSTARSEKRAKEVGVRKAIGSQQKDLILQFLIESVIFTILAFVCCLLIVVVTLPWFNALAASSTEVPFLSIGFWLTMLGSIVIITLMAGARPAFYLSSFNPVKALSLKGNATKTKSFSRKVLVVIQFSCSIILIISTVVIYQQIRFAKDRPTGYNIGRLLTSEMNEDLERNYGAFKNELLQSGAVESITTSTSAATDVSSHGDIDHWSGKYAGETVEMGFVGVSDDYMKTLGMTMRMGRDFASNSKADSSNIILNEAAVKRLRLKDPINQIVTINNQQLRIIGVVKDALMLSPFASADPTSFYVSKGWSLIYRLSSTMPTQQAVEKVGTIMAKYNPGFPFEYHFVDEEYNRKFQMEVLIGKLSGIFAGLAILVSCLGLFGLAAYVAEQRTKEIGIRKVLGAKVSQIWLLLSKDFIVLVVISCIIASPIAFYFLQKWLMQYEYRISIKPSVFILSSLIALVITLITISYQAIKSAMVNPVKSLKTE